MFEKHDLIQWLWVLGVGIAAGMVSIIHKIKTGRVSRISVFGFFGEIFSSVFFTVLTYRIAIGYGFNDDMAIGVAGMVGHMGTRVVFIFERELKNWLRSRFNIKSPRDRKTDIPMDEYDQD